MSSKTCSLLTLALLFSLLAHGLQSTDAQFAVSAGSTIISITADTDHAPFELADGTKLFIKGTEDANVSPTFFLYHNIFAHHLTPSLLRLSLSSDPSSGRNRSLPNQMVPRLPGDHHSQDISRG